MSSAVDGAENANKRVCAWANYYSLDRHSHASRVHSEEAINTVNLSREILLLLRKSYYRHVTACSLVKV